MCISFYLFFSVSYFWCLNIHFLFLWSHYAFENMLNVPGISGCFIMKVMLGYLTCRPRFSEPPSPHPHQGQDAGLPAVAMCPRVHRRLGREHKAWEAFAAFAPGGQALHQLGRWDKPGGRGETKVHSCSEAREAGAWCPLSAGTFSEPLGSCSLLLPHQKWQCTRALPGHHRGLNVLLQSLFSPWLQRSSHEGESQSGSLYILDLRVEGEVYTVSAHLRVTPILWL